MTPDDTQTMWRWLKCLWREDRDFLIWYSVASVILSLCFGVVTYCIIVSVQQ